jgi:FkbM family methyltransferase
MTSGTLIDLFRKLPFGLALTRSGKRSFSQEGEDMVLARIFEGKSNGVYVDVGAHHPIRFSNTYMFYLRGWSGINVDAMPGSMEAFRKLRPRDRNVEALISNKPGSVKYYLFNDSAMNTCDAELARQRDGLAHFRLTGTRTLQPQSLSAILDKQFGAGQEIDFMSIDVEGWDLDVLESNNWQKFRPAIVLIEDCLLSMHDAVESPGARFLKQRGYTLFAKTVNTLFFRREEPGNGNDSGDVQRSQPKR